MKNSGGCMVVVVVIAAFAFMVGNTVTTPSETRTASQTEDACQCLEFYNKHTPEADRTYWRAYKWDLSDSLDTNIVERYVIDIPCNEVRKGLTIVK